MLLDANILLYAIDRGSPQHAAAKDWLESVLNGDRRVALPWQTLGAVVRIATHPRAVTSPLSGPEACVLVNAWLASPVAWIPPVSSHTWRLFDQIVSTTRVSGNLVPDAQLAALALEHGLTVVSADTDFARFSSVRWFNPLVPGT